MSAKNPAFTAIVLAAGKGTRMHSLLPKVAHPVGGRPMVERIVRRVQELGAGEVRVVVGYGEALVRQVVEPLGAICFPQTQQKGTADAVRSAQPETIMGPVLILNGDHPLLQREDLAELLRQFRDCEADVAVITCELQDPGQYGRIVRQKNELRAIVEAKDASHETLKIREVNTGIYLLGADQLNELLPQIQSFNKQNEFYLTDIISLAVEKNKRVVGIKTQPHVCFGVNTQQELAMANTAAYKRKLDQLMSSGIVVIDPNHTYVEDTVEIGEGSILFPNVHLRGNTKIGKACVIEPNNYLSDTVVEDHVVIKASCYICEAIVRKNAEIGPFAHLRPGADVGEDCKIGNFVELKKVKFGARSKASHLAYLGDAEIGTDTNIGCGTITCNYAVDHKKYQTKIGNYVFVGSDSQFIAPVIVGDHAVIGSGSTITKDVPANSLAVARARQMIKENYQPRREPAPPAPAKPAIKR